MTRYGEFCWDPGLKPVSPEDAGLDVTGVDGLEWRRWVRQRLSPGGRKETVVHLISPPRSDSVVSAAPVPMPAWRRSISVAKRCPGTPAVWRLSAEPDVRAERLPVTEKGGASVVVVPEHRLWTLLVWVEQGEGQENRP
jgi:hypothetical protein